MITTAKKTILQNVLRKILLYGTLVLISIIFLGPFIWTSLGSFKHTEEIYTTQLTIIPKYGLHLGGYQELLARVDIIRIILNSFIVSGIGTLLSVFFCSLGGFGFAKYCFPGREILFYFLIVTLMIPFYGMVIPLFIVVRILGWTDTYQGLIIPWVANAFGIFLMRQYISAVPDELIDAARIDGSADFGIYHRVVLPLIRPGLIVYGFIQFMFYWSFLFWPLIIISKEKMYTIVLSLANIVGPRVTLGYAFSVLDWTSVLAAATIAVLPVLVIFFIFQRHIISGIMTGSIK